MTKSLSGFGLDYEKQITKKTAKSLCGMYPLPRIGYETVIAIKPDPIYSGFWFRLMVQNISGQLVLTSNNVPKSQWSNVFGVSV